MKAAIMIILTLLLLIPCLAHAELTPDDLITFSSNLSEQISFFAGCFAAIGFVGGFGGGRL